MRKHRTKRLLAALLSALLLLSMTACGSHSSTGSQPDKNSPTAQQADNQKQAANKQDEAKTEETSKGNTNTGETGKETSDKDTAGKDVSGSENSTQDGTQQEDNKTTSDSDSSNGSSSGGGSAAGGNGSSGGSTTGGSSSGGSASQPEPPAGKELTCTISISCSTILSNMDKCEESKKEWVPDNGVILSATTVTFTEGESVYDVLQRVCRDSGIQMDASWSGKYGSAYSAYVEGIANLYEFDVGSGSGWMYKVNGWFPNYGCSGYTLSQGDVICWVYTCNLGDDVGGGYAT